MPPNPTKTAIYIRVSTKKQEDKWSIPAQLRLLPEYARSRGWEIYRVYNEGGVSGETIEARPEIQRLLEDAGKGLFDICLVIELERLSRSVDLLDWLEIKKVFREAGIRIATPGQEYDLEDVEDDFLSDLFGALSKREKLKFQKRVRDGKREARAKGRWNGGEVALGYRFDRAQRKLVINPEEAEIVRLMLTDLAIRMSPPDVARELNRRGLKTKRGKPWRIHRVRKFVEDDRLLFYAGRSRLSDGTIIQAEWEPIITEEERQRLLAVKKARRTHLLGPGSGPRRPRTLLTGLGILKCGSCGYAMASTKANRRENKYYRCKSRWRGYGYDCGMRKCFRIEIIDQVVVGDLCHRLSQPDLIKKGIETLRQKSSGTPIIQRISELENQIAGLRQRQDNLLRMVEEGALEASDVRERITAIKEQMRGLRNRIQGLFTESPSYIDFSELEGLTFTPEAFFGLPLEDQRDLIEKMIHRIDVSHDRIQITYRFPIFASGRTIRRIKIL